jgi:hypothetical protein
MSTAVYVIISVPAAEREQKGDVPTLATSGQFDKQTVSKSLKKVLEESLRELGIVDPVWNLNKNGTGYQVCFPCDLETSDAVIEFFTHNKVGCLKDTSIGYE